MGVFRTAEKFSIWGLRFFQLCFAIVLLGVLSWFMHLFHRYGYSSPRQVTVPLAFSVIAIIVAFFSITAICFLGRTLQWVAALLDVVIFGGYLASAILFRHNYHIHGYRNLLRNYLVTIRTANGDSSDHNRISGLVKLCSALIIIQLILFFLTMILSLLAAKSRDRDVVHDPAVGEKRFFGRRRGGPVVSTV